MGESSSLEKELAKYQQKVETESGLPDGAAAPEAQEAKEPTKLKTALEAAIERYPQTDEEKAESLARQQERATKEDAGRTAQQEGLAKDILEQRMAGAISHEGVDALLAEQNIQPWTDESGRFMGEWDKGQAQKIYKETLAKFDGEIAAAREKIQNAEEQLKAPNQTKEAAAKIEGALLAYESKLKDLETKKYNFEILPPTPTPEPEIIAPVPEVVVEAPPEVKVRPEGTKAYIDGYMGDATWVNKDSFQPVKITGVSGTGPDGRVYLNIEGSTAAIPADEVFVPEAEEKVEATPPPAPKKWWQVWKRSAK